MPSASATTATVHQRSASGPFGVSTMTLDRALDYVASNPFFWIHD
jgi:hypothetical protein